MCDRNNDKIKFLDSSPSVKSRLVSGLLQDVAATDHGNTVVTMACEKRLLSSQVLPSLQTDFERSVRGLMWLPVRSLYPVAQNIYMMLK